MLKQLIERFVTPLRLMLWICLTSTVLMSVARADEVIQVQVKEPYIEFHSGPAGGFPVIHVAEKD
ncbi:hypothetical protein [uncultured Paraglaciecola sp.]|uniref:hypothetical protein n=1 Tax=uncultured Paraglaciecola sp. TaxID=1765024 RepID=UPI00261E4B67|nr:hypothetical protein [uncultured Paraglaciecola sp.]